MRMLRFWFAMALAITGSPSVAQSWTSDADYPKKALREGREGTTKFKLVISAKGKIKECLITESSGSPDLDQATCKVMMRGLFAPAKNEAGEPVESNFERSMVWKLPK